MHLTTTTPATAPALAVAARMRAGLIDAPSVSDWYSSCASQTGYRA